MKRLPLAFVLGLTALPLACNGDETDTQGNLVPYRQDWRVEAEVPFPYLDDAGQPQITIVRIGGRTYQENFANRGDVIVEFEEGRNTIQIEMRRFTMSLSEAQAQEDFAALQLWAYSSNQTSPRKPSEMEPMNSCIPIAENTNPQWRDDCAIRVYYDGQSQIARAGADLRVKMPASYRHNVRIITQDMDGDNDYINRGTVCIDNLNGSAEVDLENGVASVILSEASQPIPICTPEQIAACDDWEHEDEPAAWHQDCDCILETQSAWGAVRVESADSTGANITIDAPSDLWMNITARNDSPNNLQESHCRADVDLPDFEVEDRPNNWSVRGVASVPSAVASGGYGVQALSKDCQPVLYTPSPAEFVGYNQGHEQMSEERGHVRVCSNCIRGQRCEDLIDG
jgi:hypothetical protein